MASEAQYIFPLPDSPRPSGLSTPSARWEAPSTPTPDQDRPLLDANQREYFSEKPVSPKTEPTNRSRRGLYALIAGIVLVVLILAIVIPIYFAVIKPKNDSGSSGSAGHIGGGSGGSDNPASPSGAITGGDGSEIIADDGTTFTYKNEHGGYWVADPSDPFNDGAQVNSWTPPLNASWIWGQDRIQGVNLGGLFVLEPFISPALFQKYPDSVDEWTLSEAMAADTANGGMDQLEEHYKTFITEQDIAQIAGAGLNWIRLPVPYWAIETWPGEPYLAKTSWSYILRVIGWCRKYGLRVKLDLHAMPGSQNGYNHSGKLGQVDFMYGTMGLANAQRALYYIRVYTQFFSQPEYQNVVQVFGFMNEALLQTIGKDQLRSFYLEAYNVVREITGVGEGHGPFISLHDGFVGLSAWSDFLPGADRVAYDTHPYFAFDGGPQSEPIATGTGDDAGGMWPLKACDAWGPDVNKTQATKGVTFAGEFSNGYNDCGLFLTGTTAKPVNPDCDTLWADYGNWNETVKAGVQAYAEASMDALQNWFFWTWKIGESKAGKVEAPLWSYKLGLENGWIPTDPRVAVGKCASLGAKTGDWDGTFESWQTGGDGAGTIAPSATSSITWPPATISGVDAAASELPVYTLTASVATLTPIPSATGVSGWFDDSDKVLAPAPIEGCTYPDAWDAKDADVPSGCGAGSIASVTQAP